MRVRDDDVSGFFFSLEMNVCALVWHEEFHDVTFRIEGMETVSECPLVPTILFHKTGDFSHKLDLNTNSRGKGLGEGRGWDVGESGVRCRSGS